MSTNWEAVELQGTIDKLHKENEQLKGQLQDYKDDFARAYETPCEDEKHCTCVPALLKRSEVAEEALEKIDYRGGICPYFIAEEALKQITKLGKGG